MQQPPSQAIHTEYEVIGVSRKTTKLKQTFFERNRDDERAPLPEMLARSPATGRHPLLGSRSS